MIDVDKLKKAAVAVYLAADEGPAKDISEMLNMAAKEIEDLRELLKYGNVWISVKDRLPENGERVLTWKWKTYNGKRLDHWWLLSATIYQNGFNINNESEVTHWQYAPEPPEQEKNQ